MQTIEALKIYNSHGKYLVHTPARRGVEIFLYLARHGIDARVSRRTSAAYDCLEVEEDVNVEALRTLLDQWSN